MIKKLLLILIALMPFTSKAQMAVGNWNVYPMYSSLSKMVQTPDKVYFVSGNYLYSYDKNSQETYNYTSRNKLSDNIVSNIFYNNDKKYLLVTYTTGNIDLLYDNGDVVNLPDIKDAVLTYDITINDVAFSGDNIYVATKFGLIIFDEKKHEVKQSGVYNKEISLVTCVGDYVVIDQNHNLYFAHKDARFEMFENFKLFASGHYIDDIEGLDNNGLLSKATGKNVYKYTINFTTGGVSRIGLIETADVTSLIYGKDGYYCISASTVYSISRDGIATAHSALPSSLASQTLSIWDNANIIWAGNANGIASYDITGGNLTVLQDKFKPESVSVDYPFYITSDSNGKIYISNRSESTNYGFKGQWWPTYISTIYNGKIEDITPTNVTPTHASNPATSKKNTLLYDSYQLAVDPEDPETYYVGTFWEGVYKIKDRKMVSQYNPSNSTMLESWGCRVHALSFDKENNLWCCNEVLSAGQPSLHILPAAARKKETTTASDWIPISLGDFKANKDVVILICKKSDMIFICDGRFDGWIVAYDTNGTYTDTSDDNYYLWDSFIDQDGKNYAPDRVYSFAEDENGRVWMGTSNGVIEITNPKNATNPSMTINRLKVPRNDGTNYADYLLDAIQVTSISVDNSNRKWLGTMSNGVYLVNETGSEILEHFASDNSYHPGGITYSVFADKFSNSVYIGTQYGLVAYSSNSAPAKEDYSEVYAYPNPVKPDYTGWITIKGLMDNSLVKIADSAGNVFYTTRSEGGMVVWDGCNSNGERVKSGVYFVYASQNENEQSSGAVTKILVVR